MNARFRRLYAIVLLWPSFACTTWVPHSGTPGDDGALPVRLRLHLDSGDEITLARPVLEADSSYVGDARGTTLRVPRRAVVEAEESRTNWPATIGAVLGVAAVGVGVAALILANMDFSWGAR